MLFISRYFLSVLHIAAAAVQVRVQYAHIFCYFRRTGKRHAGASVNENLYLFRFDPETRRHHDQKDSNLTLKRDPKKKESRNGKQIKTRTRWHSLSANGEVLAAKSNNNKIIINI